MLMLGQLLLFQQMAEVRNRGFIRQCFCDTSKTGKPADTLNFIESVFHLTIRKTKPVLQAVYAAYLKRHP